MSSTRATSENKFRSNGVKEEGHITQKGNDVDPLTHTSRQPTHHNTHLLQYPEARSPGTSHHAAPSEMLSGLLLEDAILFNSIRKVENPPDKVLFLALLAGVWVGMGGLAAASAAGGIPASVREDWVFLSRFLMGAWFAFALHMIAMFGGDLFTGNTMTMAIGWYNRVIPFRALLLNWLLVYIGNWGGTLFMAYFFGYLGNMFDTPQYRSYLDYVVLAKLEHLTWGQVLIRGIGANIMVCMAMTLGIAARGAAGKIIALWFPVVMFVICGFEHCVANMFFTSLGLMYGAGPSTIGRQWYNQSAAALGNIIGGAIFMGLCEHVMNHWKSPIFRSRGAGTGTLTGHEVESTRRAQDNSTTSLIRVASLSTSNRRQRHVEEEETGTPRSGESRENEDERKLPSWFESLLGRREGSKGRQSHPKDMV
ncbi:hypothetical protein B0A52_05009 [Exophiala mesophila]|uniref:Formate/nitrite transporter n=1 Tax=Exophiala mesophila TaxID=212818 RepID=A0A438N720_EXOME|nr:hypothetical protein B0A52_05009 [Exophiala mesophila]